MDTLGTEIVPEQAHCLHVYSFGLSQTTNLLALLYIYLASVAGKKKLDGLMPTESKPWAKSAPEEY